MELFFREIAGYVALVLEALSILMIAIGAVQASFGAVWPALRNKATHGVRRAAWLSMARWLMLSLEFMLAADVVRTAVAPTWDEIGQLAAIAVIRTFLNFFLERDLEQANAIKLKRAGEDDLNGVHE
jgi:uncharacterized membrane protein